MDFLVPLPSVMQESMRWTEITLSGKPVGADNSASAE